MLMNFGDFDGSGGIQQRWETKRHLPAIRYNIIPQFMR
jgi:hypothetical protein